MRGQVHPGHLPLLIVRALAAEVPPAKAERSTGREGDPVKRELELGGKVKATLDAQGVCLQQDNLRVQLPREDFISLMGLWANQHFTNTIRPQEVRLSSTRVRWDEAHVAFAANGRELILTRAQMSRLLFAYLMGDDSVNDPRLRGSKTMTE